MVSNKANEDKDIEVDLADQRFKNLLEDPEYRIQQGKTGLNKEYVEKIKKLKKN